GEEIALIASHPITIDFADRDVSGTASCNRFAGTFELSGSSIEFGNLAMTEMACFPEETMEAEALFARALPLVDTVAIDDELTLSGDGVELVFAALEPVPEAELTNTVWVLDGLISADAVSSVSGERATLELFTDGSVLGGTGCRLLTGQYTITGSEVLFNELSAQGECDSSLAEQDDHVVTVLGDGFRVEIEDQRLTLWSAGDLGLVYRAEG
ncbi:MAG: META domain-containing protein, partial [Acidimicrobiia bacterium]